MAIPLDRRRYESPRRREAAEDTRRRILHAARVHFAARGIDKVTVAEIATGAQVAGSTIFAIYKSKEGILRALMEEALFGRSFEHARERLQTVSDPVDRIGLTAQLARAIYEQEDTELSFVRGASAFSPALRKLEQEFEALRYEMQEERVRALFEAARQRKDLTFEEARRLLWMYTSRDIFRMLVQEAGWSGDRYEAWLAETLLRELTDAAPDSDRADAEPR